MKTDTTLKAQGQTAALRCDALVQPLLKFETDVGTPIHGESVNASLTALGYTTENAGQYRKRILLDGREVTSGTAHEVSAWLQASHQDYFG